MTNLQTKNKPCVRHSKHVQFGPANTGNKSPRYRAVAKQQMHSYNILQKHLKKKKSFT